MDSDSYTEPTTVRTRSVSGSYARPIHTQNQTQTQGKDVPFSAENGAAAPSEDRERRAQQAIVVAAYAKAATEAGVPIIGAARAMIAGQAGYLLDDGWPVEAIVRAVDRFARRRRFAGHLAQWCREYAMDEREAVHFARKKLDRATAADTMRNIGRAIRDLGL